MKLLAFTFSPIAQQANRHIIKKGVFILLGFFFSFLATNIDSQFQVQVQCPETTQNSLTFNTAGGSGGGAWQEISDKKCRQEFIFFLAIIVVVLLLICQHRWALCCCCCCWFSCCNHVNVNLHFVVPPSC